MSQDEEARLIDKLRKIEALFARADTPGERVAAGAAAERIRARLLQFERSEPAIEYRFSLPDTWSRTLFIALLRRYDIAPYRYSGQRRTTVMARVTRSFIDDVLWPEFRELNAVLREHLERVTRRVVSQAIHGNDEDVSVRMGAPPTRVRDVGE